MNQTLLNVLGILAMIEVMRTVLLITAYSIGAVRVWREDRRLRRDFQQVLAEKRVDR